MCSCLHFISPFLCFTLFLSLSPTSHLQLSLFSLEHFTRNSDYHFDCQIFISNSKATPFLWKLRFIHLLGCILHSAFFAPMFYLWHSRTFLCGATRQNGIEDLACRLALSLLMITWSTSAPRPTLVWHLSCLLLVTMSQTVAVEPGFKSHLIKGG